MVDFGFGELIIAWPLLFMCEFFIDDESFFIEEPFIDEPFMDEPFIDEPFIACMDEGLGFGVAMLPAMAGAAINMIVSSAVAKRIVFDLLCH
jgi:hypothetical protein